MLSMTADQTIALTSVIASGVVALVAVVGSITTGALDRRARRKEARVARQQPRLERAYLELATYAHRRRKEANTIRSTLTPNRPTTPLPTAEIERAYALVVSIASEQVRALILEFGTVLTSIWNADIAMSAIEHPAAEAQAAQAADPAAWSETYAAFGKGIAEAKQNLADIEDRLYEQMRRELGE
jgi:hypothetical protein